MDRLGFHDLTGERECSARRAGPRVRKGG
jgi:hypothetical protein